MKKSSIAIALLTTAVLGMGIALLMPSEKTHANETAEEHAKHAVTDSHENESAEEHATHADKDTHENESAEEHADEKDDGHGHKPGESCGSKK